MRGLLFLLIGLAAACAIGMLLIGGPATPAQVSEPAVDGPTIAVPMELWLLVAGCWLTPLLSRPAWLIGVLASLALMLGCATIVIGASSAYGDHAMRPNETVSGWIVFGGVLMLLSLAAVWLRWALGSRDR